MVEDDPAPSTTDGPRTFADVLGQSEAVERLKALAAIAAVRPVPHMLIVGPDGSGKRTLARVLANECSANLVTAEATAIARTVDLMGILTNLGYGDFFFLEAVSGLPHPVEELLIPALRNNRVEFVIDKGVHARMLHYELRHFTCIGSVERLGDVSAKLRPLFPVVVPLQPYAVDSLAELAIRRARFLGADITLPTADMLAALAEGSLQKLLSFIPLLGLAQDRSISHDDAVAMLRRLGFAVRDPSAVGSDAPGDLMQLTGAEFERVIARLVSRMGFRAEITKASGDGGVDVIAVFDRPMLRGRYLIQCKRFTDDNLVGAPLVREFYGAVVADRAIKGIFITTSSFTSQARQFAETLPLELIDGEALRRLLSEAEPETTA